MGVSQVPISPSLKLQGRHMLHGGLTHIFLSFLICLGQGGEDSVFFSWTSEMGRSKSQTAHLQCKTWTGSDTGVLCRSHPQAARLRCPQPLLTPSHTRCPFRYSRNTNLSSLHSLGEPRLCSPFSVCPNSNFTLANFRTWVSEHWFSINNM